MTKNMWIWSFWLNFETFHIIPDNFFDRKFRGVIGSMVKLLGLKVCTNNLFHWFLVHGLLAFSKFDRLDPSYQTSKKREFDGLEKIWQFYQPSSYLSKKKRLFLLILGGKTLFSKKRRSELTLQTHFFKMSQTSVTQF